MGRATVRGFTDAHIRRDMPYQSFTKSNLMRVVGAGRVDQGRAFLWVPRPFAPRSIVSSAKLRVITREPLAGTTTLELHRVADRFTVTEVRWAGQPNIIPATVVSLTRGTSGWDQIWEFDVTEHMQAIADGAPWWGWRLSTTTQDAVLRVYSEDHGSGLRPALTVEWADHPSAPTGLAPSGNQAVSVPAPLLQMVYSDMSGDDLAAVRVQSHSEPIQSGAPLWDKTIETSAPVVDLAEHADFPAVPLNGSRWWRAQVQDSSGLWSRWSDWAQWQRRRMPTVAITSPTDGGSTESSSPTVQWSVSGGTQSAYMVRVYNNISPSAPGSLRYSTGRVSSTSTRAVVVPAGVMSRDDKTYWIHLRVWDRYPRHATSTDPGFVDHKIAVTFDRDGSLTPVTLGLVPTPDQVGMELTWTRDIDPGRWAILRDGEVVTVVESGPYVAGEWSLPLNAFTVFTDDTALYSDKGWRWVDWTADPRRDHTWEVAPVVGDVTGKGTPVQGRLEPVGVWLVHHQTGSRVMLTNDDVPSGWGMVEQSTRHLPLGARRPVLITQGMGGYEGRTTGELTGQAFGRGPSAQEQRDLFLELKERQGQTLRMVLADQNLPVALSSMTVAPAPAGANLRFVVGFDWAQVAEFDYDPRFL